MYKNFYKAGSVQYMTDKTGESIDLKMKACINIVCTLHPNTVLSK